MNRRLKILAFFFLLFFLCDSSAAKIILKVKLLEGRRSVKISSASNIRVGGHRDGAKELKKIFFKKVNRNTLSLNGRIFRKGSYFLSSASPIKLGQKLFGGTLQVTSNSSGVMVINFIELEEYLKGVIPSEMSAKWHTEALKAQAVASRTYAVFRMNQNQNRLWHLTGDTNDQVYGGFILASPNVRRAVEETRNLVITKNGVVVPTFYHSNSGGTTEDSANVWNQSHPHIAALKVPYGRSDPNYNWQFAASEKSVLKALKKLGRPLKKIDEIEIQNFTVSGRVQTLKMKGDRTRKIHGSDLRKALGYGKLKSTKFNVKKKGNRFYFTGSGFGHGVGLCQWCSKEMAEKGYSYRQILMSFYRNVKISSLRVN